MIDKQTIIVVDDDHDIVENLKIILEKRGGFEVVGTAYNGKEALLLLEEIQADLMLIDLEMPVMNGIQLICDLNGKYPFMKKMVLTTFCGEKDIAEAIISGADSYITKDLSDKLIHAIKLLLQGQSIFDRRVLKWIRKIARQTNEDAPISKKILFENMTLRERQTCRLLASGCTNSQIAEKLFIAEGTVRNYMSSIYEKTGISDRIQLVMALKKDLPIETTDSDQTYDDPEEEPEN
ncbi:MAG: response regulator transcription factor [Clostridiales bacterium]|nr:response regulator transcription factor [Clostridiales bacterium]